MSDDKVTIEVDGAEVEAVKGQMLIEVTDRVGAYVPRFCYHEKLSVAANCRMCLVEVEKGPKPLPACATPVMDGMKVFTKSAYAIGAQKATMEFLLINHPLDCPICDQGGECELQDLAMGYGSDVSRYNDRKRVVKDKDLGPLVSTDMTRCIHCTRCVRFGEEIAGMPELGTIGRAENMRISTFIEKSVDHEMSANIIDLCPVGALNNKPYRYSARAWEMVQRAAISPHDCVGSNMHAHVLRGRIKRMVPHANEEINETWLSDRDRFGFEGIYSSDRLLQPRLKVDGEWRDIDWEEALQTLADKLQAAAADKVGILASPSSTLEEARLLERIAAHLGTNNIDHRLRQLDFADQENDPLIPTLGCSIAELEKKDAILMVGSDVRREAPIIAHRIRKASLTGAKVCFADQEKRPYHFDVEAQTTGEDLADQLIGILSTVSMDAKLPKSIAAMCKGVSASEEQGRIANALRNAERAQVVIGHNALRHPRSSTIRALAAAIADVCGADFGVISEGANAAGAHLAGLLPHRGPAGVPRKSAGIDAVKMNARDLDVVVLFGLEPDQDVVNGADAVEHLCSQEFVVSMSPYKTYALDSCANLQLPIGTFAETSGTFVNCEGRWQSFGGVATPVGAARPGWKVLRVLANLLGVENTKYQDSVEIRDELQAVLGDAAVESNGNSFNASTSAAADSTPRTSTIPMYEVDGIVRRAVALQLTMEARRSRGEPV